MVKARSRHGHTSSRSKPATKANVRQETSSRKSGRMVFLEPAQIEELKKLARDHGTTLAVEISNAVDAYVLGIAPTDVRKLDELLDKLSATTDRAKHALDEAVAVAKAAKRPPKRRATSKR
jgi:hypothetical protein